MQPQHTPRRCGRWGHVRTLRGSLLLFLLLGWCHVVLADSVPSSVFPIPDALRPNVTFWKRVFAAIDNTGGLLHDMEDLAIVYHIWYNDLPSDQPLRQASIDEVRNRYRAILTTLADGKRFDLTSDEQRVWDMFKSKQYPEAFRAALGAMRFQGGMRGRFADGIVRSWSYLPEMEQIFADAGLPVELTRLPHVESSFENRALSKVGAAGVWQFMPGTGRRFMRVDSEVDERLNVRAATVAATRLLRENYEKLGSWPLAITAYNHGAYGMKQAVATVGTTDFGTIVQRYRGPSFGFASQNFYAEFLAALDVSKNHKQYFGDLLFAEPSRPFTLEARAGGEFSAFVEISQPVTLDAHTLGEPHPVLLASVRMAGLSARQMTSPAPVPVQEEITLPQETAALPAGTAARDEIVSTPLPLAPPTAPVDPFKMAAPRPAALPDSWQMAAPRPEVMPPPVVAAPRPAPAEARTARAVPVLPPTQVTPRQTVLTTGPAAPSSPAPVLPPAASVPRPTAVETRSPMARSQAMTASSPLPTLRGKEYLVRPGDTLTAIAQRHGTPVAMLATTNGLSPRANVQTGQTLLLPATAPAVTSAAKPAEKPLVRAEKPVVSPAAKTLPKEVVVPVASPFKTAGAFPVQRTGLTEVTLTPIPASVTALRPDLSKVPATQFAQRRVQDHRGLEEDFLRKYRVGEVVTRKLKPGETLARVAREAPGVPLWLLQRYNTHLDPHTARPGTELRIPKVVARMS